MHAVASSADRHAARSPSERVRRRTSTPRCQLRVRRRGPYRSRSDLVPQRVGDVGVRRREIDVRVRARAPPCAGTDRGSGAPIPRARIPRRCRALCRPRRSWPARARPPRRRRGRARASSGSSATASALRSSFCTASSDGSPAVTPATIDSAPVSVALDLLPVGDHFVGAGDAARRRTRAGAGARACRGCGARRRRR